MNLHHLAAKFAGKIAVVASYQAGPSSRLFSAAISAFHFQSKARRRGLPTRHAGALAGSRDCVCGVSVAVVDSLAIG